MTERTRGLSSDMLPDALPIFPLPGAVLLPDGELPLNIFEPRYLNMIEDALVTRGRLIGMIQPVAENDEHLIADGVQLYQIGCAGRITQFSETGDGRYVISLQGLTRFRVGEELEMIDGYRRVRPDYSSFTGDMINDDSDQPIASRDKLLSAMGRYFDIKGIEADMSSVSEAPDALLVNTLAMTCPLEPGEKQALLECPDIAGRADLLTRIFEISAHGDGSAPAGVRQ